MFEILDGGLVTTVQDLGRDRYFSIALVKSGAIDPSSLRIGNLLVRNEPGEAGLEVSVGLKIKALSPMIIAITGGDLAPKINHRDIPMWETIKLDKGDILSFGSIRLGFRSYLAVAGGIDVPSLFGSKSTYVSGRRGDLGFGGFKGRPIRKGDILEIGRPRRPIDSFEFRKVKPSLIPKFGNVWVLRVVLGPFEHFLTERGLETFLSHPWKVSYRAGRTGYWYDGPLVEFKERSDHQLKGAGTHPSNCISDGVPVGGVQAPFGVPVIFCPDQSTIGGHLKIATVISADLDKVGQSKPGDTTFFEQISVNEAQELLRRSEELLREETLLI